jgi:hypothetical protein
MLMKLYPIGRNFDVHCQVDWARRQVTVVPKEVNLHLAQGNNRISCKVWNGGAVSQRD